MDYISSMMQSLNADGVDFVNVYVFEDGNLKKRRGYRFYWLNDDGNKVYID